MKIILYIFLLTNSLLIVAQQKVIEITNIKNGKTHVYSENQRVKIRTLDRKKHVGRIHITDNNTLLINKKLVKTDSILSLKKQPFFFGTLKSALFLSGLATVGTSIFKSSKGEDSAIILFFVGTGATVSSGLIEGLNTKYSKKKWTFRIVEKNNKL